MTAKLDARHFFIVLLLIALTALAACGGGGDDTEDDPGALSPNITGLSVSVANIGDTVEIYGLNFGLTQGTGRTSCNGTDFTITNWTDTHLTATVPAGMTSGIVSVFQSGKTSTSGPEAQLFIGTMPTGSPLINAINPNYGHTGAEVLIIGRNFGDNPTGSTVYFQPNNMSSQVLPVAAEVVTVEVGGALVPQWTRTSIKVKVPGDTLLAGESRVYVTVGANQSNTRPFTKLPDEIVGDTMIEGVEPATGPVGTLITVTGNGFGFSQGNSTITVNGLPLDVIDWSNTEIMANIPAGASSGAIRVVVNGSPFDSQPFTVGNTPLITGVSPGSIKVGSPLTVHGTHFGVDPGTGSLKVGSTIVAVDATNWSDSQIYVPKLPKLNISDPENIPVVVTADNGNSSEPFIVSMTSNLTVISTIDPPAGEVGTTAFNFNVIVSGGTGEYEYELIPDASDMSKSVTSQESKITYTYPDKSGFTTKTVKTKIRVTDSNTADNTIVDGPDVLVVAKGSPVIISMAVQDFNRGGINSPNNWVLNPLTGDYDDFSFNGSDIYFTSVLSSVSIGAVTLPPFRRDLESFMENGNDIHGATQRPYGYRYGSPSSPAPGSYVRIMGLNFSDTIGQVWLNSTLDNQGQPSGGVLLTMDNIIEWTNNAVVIRMPGAVNQNLSGLVVLQAGSKYAKSASPLIASAYVTAVSPSTWQVGGPDTIQITGFDFQPPQVPGMIGSGLYIFWVVSAQYNDPFQAGQQVTRQVLRIQPVPPSSIDGTTIFFPTSELTGPVQIEVTNPERTSAQIVNGTLADGNYLFWIWSGALTTGSKSQITNSGIFSQTYAFSRGGGGGPTTYSVSGRVTDQMLPGPDNGAQGVTVTLSGLASKNTTTDMNGNYTFTGLANGNYTVTPSGGGFASFSPASTPVIIASGNQTGINFSGSDVPGP